MKKIFKLIDRINSFPSSKEVIKFLMRNQYLALKLNTRTQVGRLLVNYIYYIDRSNVRKYNYINLAGSRLRDEKFYINFPECSNFIKMSPKSYIFYTAKKAFVIAEGKLPDNVPQFYLTVYFLGPDRYKERKNFFDFCKRYVAYCDAKDKVDMKIGYYGITDDFDKRTNFIVAKQYDDIVSDEKDAILSEIDKWKEMKDWYIEHHLPHKIGIILYGEPGCGKTSIINMIAHKEKRMIFSIDLNLSLKDIKDSISNLVDRDLMYASLFAIEDIDCFLDMEDKSDEQKQAIEQKIQWLLQFLDGTESIDGSMVIITTNHFDKIDNRLLRKQRLDIQKELKPFREKDALIMWTRFGLDKNDFLSEIERGNIRIPIKPVDLQSICIEHCFMLVKEEKNKITE